MVPNAASVPCSCSELAIAGIPWNAVVEHDDRGNACTVVRAACPDCGRLPGEPGWRLDRSHLLMLRAGIRIGQLGTWKKLGLPAFREIGFTVGSAELIRRTIRRRRLHVKYDHLSHQGLEGLVRDSLGISHNDWPRGVVACGWSCPVVVHHGLAWKFAHKRDRQHLYLVNYIDDTLRFPTEVWLGTHRGKPRIRFFKKLSTAGDVHNMLVCADPRDALVVTAYIAAPHVCDASREGTLLYASWAIPAEQKKGPVPPIPSNSGLPAAQCTRLE